MKKILLFFMIIWVLIEPLVQLVFNIKIVGFINRLIIPDEVFEVDKDGYRVEGGLMAVIFSLLIISAISAITVSAIGLIWVIVALG